MNVLPETGTRMLPYSMERPHENTHQQPDMSGPDRRVPGLDGLRGAAIVMVVVSHYFGELEGGLHATMFGWIGVDIFFVLSGYLIGKLILDRRHHANFFSVFYVRRFCRIVPAYLVALALIFALLHFIKAPWAQAD